jgi:hypothetical protein
MKINLFSSFLFGVLLLAFSAESLMASSYSTTMGRTEATLMPGRLTEGSSSATPSL